MQYKAAGRGLSLSELYGVEFSVLSGVLSHHYGPTVSAPGIGLRDVLVVWKLDRLSCSLRGVLTIMERLAESQACFISSRSSPARALALGSKSAQIIPYKARRPEQGGLGKRSGASAVRPY